MGNPLTLYEAVTDYCNFYEFTTNKETVDERAQDFITEPWPIEVSGLVKNPRTYALKDILVNFDQEERIYRMRCFEGWSMVIPWLRFPLNQLLEEVHF
ncbi:MAG: molybdopterin-dependent oxidoreductase [Chloroflexota bacterium]|nr:molybdopterin-dependent oxidoreductase [Chloroflexota bacterium]